MVVIATIRLRRPLFTQATEISDLLGHTQAAAENSSLILNTLLPGATGWIRLSR